MVTQPVVPLSTLNPMGNMYPFAHVFEVETNAQESVDFWKIPDGTIITMVLVEVRVAGTGSAANIIVGDDDTDNGYILAATVCGATVGDVFGDAVADRGVYLEAGATGTHAGSWKVYTDVDKELKMDCSASLTTEATVRVMVFGWKMDQV